MISSVDVEMMSLKGIVYIVKKWKQQQQKIQAAGPARRRSAESCIESRRIESREKGQLV